TAWSRRVTRRARASRGTGAWSGSGSPRPALWHCTTPTGPTSTSSGRCWTRSRTPTRPAPPRPTSAPPPARGRPPNLPRSPQPSRRGPGMTDGALPNGGWLRRLAAACWRYKPLVLLAFGASLAGMTITALVPLVQRAIVDNSILSHRRALWPLALLLVAAAL